MQPKNKETERFLVFYNFINIISPKYYLSQHTMKILWNWCLDDFIKLVSKDINKQIKKFKSKAKTVDFSYLNTSSSVYSSNIEGNSLDLNSFINLTSHKKKTNSVQEIENLIKSYEFAQKNPLTEKNLLYIHSLLAKTLLISSKRWIYRQEKVWVFWSTWLIYLAIEAEYVWQKMKDLFDDIHNLLSQNISQEEVFYYASLAHLVFVHIHPFADGNGRTARLLEKWFLSSKLWIDFWKLPLEAIYKEKRNLYYKNINLWVNYYELDYKKSLPFILMSIHSLSHMQESL